MYLNYQEDPNSVHETWRKYFDGLEAGREYDEADFNRPTVVTSSRKPAANDANQSHLAVSYFLKCGEGEEKNQINQFCYFVYVCVFIFITCECMSIGLVFLHLLAFSLVP